jgi:hypothetical protein
MRLGSLDFISGLHFPPLRDGTPGGSVDSDEWEEDHVDDLLHVASRQRPLKIP